jgi:hypothetical protein
MLRSLLETKLKPNLERLKTRNKQCKFETNNLSISKKQILDQSTFELCKYSYYLDYLSFYYKDITNIFDLKQNTNLNNIKYDPSIIENLINNIQIQIADEKEHTYKIYPLAFTAYSEYQSNYPIHITLELLKDNLILFRENLYKALSPISQAIYKFINAMSK